MSRHLDRQRGASLVEFAIVMPLIVLLVFGIVEFGSAYSDLQNLRQAIREASRQVTTTPQQFETSGSFDAGKLRSFIESESGLSTPSTRLHLAWTTGPRSAGDSFQICATYDLKSLTGIIQPFMANSALHSNVTLRFEDDYAKSIPGSGETVSPCT